MAITLAQFEHKYITEGEHVFTVIDEGWVKNNPKFNTYFLTIRDEFGVTKTLRYNLSSQGGINAFSFIVSSISGNFDMGDYDDAAKPSLGIKFNAVVSYSESDAINENTGKPYRNFRLDKCTYIGRENVAGNENEGDESKDFNLDELDALLDD